MHADSHSHTFTQNITASRILHCRPFSTVLHTLIDPITGQRSQDSPIVPQYTIGPPPLTSPHPPNISLIYSPSSLHTLLLSCHLSLRLLQMAIDCAHRAFILCLSPSQMCLPITSPCSLYIHNSDQTNLIYKRAPALLLQPWQCSVSFFLYSSVFC